MPVVPLSLMTATFTFRFSILPQHSKPNYDFRPSTSPSVSTLTAFTFLLPISFRASKHAVARLIVVRVWPNVLLHTSLIPASASIFLHSSATLRPLPFGAGMSSIFTEPHLPENLNGMVWGVLQPHCQLPHPLLTFMRLIFAFLNAFSLESTVSLDFPYPRPT